MVHSPFNLELCLSLLEYEDLVMEKFHKDLETHDVKRFFELQNQLGFVKDFIVWEKSFSQYLKLCTDFETGLIDSELFMDEFFDLFLMDKERLKNFVFNFENLKRLNITPKSAGFFSIIEITSIQFDLFIDDEPTEDQLQSYIKKTINSIKNYK